MVYRALVISGKSRVQCVGEEVDMAITGQLVDIIESHDLHKVEQTFMYYMEQGYHVSLECEDD
jgi:hypothetical protein